MTPASVSLPSKLHNDPWICQLFICKDITYWNCVSRVSMRPTAKNYNENLSMEFLGCIFACRVFVNLIRILGIRERTGRKGKAMSERNAVAGFLSVKNEQ